MKKQPTHYGVPTDSEHHFYHYMQKYPELYTHLATIAQQHLTTPKAYIIDLGMGPGLLTTTLQTHLPQATILGIEPNQHMLHLAKQHTHHRTPIIQAQAHDLPLHSSTIDMVISRFSLPYWKDPKTCFQEIYHILKPNGILLLDVLNKNISKTTLFFIKLHMKYRGAPGIVIRYHFDAYHTAFSEPDLRALLTDIGFKTNQVSVTKKDWHFITIAQKP